MCLCNTCKTELSIRESNEPACCAWYLENVVIYGIPATSCSEYRPVDSVPRIVSKLNPQMTGYVLRWINSNQFIALVNTQYGRGEMIGHKDFWDFIDL